MSQENNTKASQPTPARNAYIFHFFIAGMILSIVAFAAGLHHFDKGINNFMAKSAASRVVLGIEQLQAMHGSADIGRPIETVSVAYFDAMMLLQGARGPLRDARSYCGDFLLRQTRTYAADVLRQLAYDPERTVAGTGYLLENRHDILAADIKSCELNGDL